MPSKTTYVAPIGGGLGDLILTLPALQYLIAQQERTLVVLRSPRQSGLAELIPGLSGSVREVDFDATKLGAGDRYINLRDHPLQTENLWGSAEFQAKFPDYRIADIMRHICYDFGIKADFDIMQPLPFNQRPDAAGKVLFVPGSEAGFKSWIPDRWLQLKRRLEMIGETAVVLGQPHRSSSVEQVIRLGIPWLETPTVRDLLDVVSSARAMVSIDTGAMHLALQQDIPAVAMFVNQPGSFHFMRTVPHCLPVLSDRCRPECVQATFDKKLNEVTQYKEWQFLADWDCPFLEEKPCMGGIDVDMVFQKTMSALRLADSRSKGTTVSVNAG